MCERMNGCAPFLTLNKALSFATTYEIEHEF